MTSIIINMVPDSTHAVHRNGKPTQPNQSCIPRLIILLASSLRKDMERQMEAFRNFDTYSNQAFNRPRLFSTAHVEALPPLSPRQMPVSDDQRPSPLRHDVNDGHQGPSGSQHLMPARRFGSISVANTAAPASRLQPSHAFPPGRSNLPREASASPPPSSSASHTYLPRRHTSADIRSDGWNPLQAQAQMQAQAQTQAPMESSAAAQSQSPFASGYSSTQWPSSPNRTPNAGDQQLRDSLARYQLGAPAAEPSPNVHFTAPNSASPAAQHHASTLNQDHPAPSNNASENSWVLPAARFQHLKDPLASSGTSTRKSSMASNVHNLLNPIGGVDVDDDDVDPDDLRKRKRVV